MLGSPDLPGQPLAARRDAPPEQRSIAELVGQVEAHLEQNPEDGRGWEVIGPVYMRLGRYDDAVKARRNALRLLGATAEREADLGEALTGAANGIVTAEAKAAFERALDARSERRPGALFPRPRRRAGRTAARKRPRSGARCWPRRRPDAPWVGFVRQSLARVDPDAPAAQPGPSADDVAAAERNVARAAQRR